MKVTRESYLGSPCWQLETRWFKADADWNVHHRAVTGVSLSAHSPETPAIIANAAVLSSRIAMLCTIVLIIMAIVATIISMRRDRNGRLQDDDA